MSDDMSTRSYLTQGAKVEAQEAKAEAARSFAVQVESDEEFQSEQAEVALNPFSRKRREKSETLESRRSSKAERKEAAASLKTSPEASAKKYSEKNSELDENKLLAIRGRLKSGMGAQEILDLIAEFYQDPALVDEVLEFLEEAAPEELRQDVKKSREQHNSKNGPAIKAGRNMGAESRDPANKALGSPTDLRTLYRDITGKPRDPYMLFEELSNKFDYAKLQTAIKFLFHALGADFNSKGPSIEPAELQRLMEETRVLQGILGVYRFFEGRMGALAKYFSNAHLTLPQQLTFQTLAKQFMALLNEKYTTAMRVLRLGILLGIDKELMAKILTISLMRDAVRNVAPRLYRNTKHKFDLLTSIGEALEQLEDQYEEAQQKEERAQGDK